MTKKETFRRRTPVSRIILARMAKEIASESFALPMADLVSPARGHSNAALARQCAMYLAHVVGQLTLGEISETFKRDRSTVGHACANIEDRRESMIFDMQITYMEKRLRNRIRSAEREGVLFAPHSEQKSVLFAH